MTSGMDYLRHILKGATFPTLIDFSYPSNVYLYRRLDSTLEFKYALFVLHRASNKLKPEEDSISISLIGGHNVSPKWVGGLF